ncbi:MAG: signal transduction histidine kinase/CheY-like chemotaxis protein [Glaciecola sp.]|jgi:signal transduction histidine kinase/CheY-like chemotaxis protein
MVTMLTHSITKRIIILFSCLLGMSGAQANWGTTVATDDNSINLGPDIQWVKDDTNQLTFEQVKRLPQEEFNNGSQYTFNRGYTSSGYWLRFRLNVPTELINSPWLLEIPFPLLDYVALYSPDKNNAYSVIYTGDRSLFSQRDLNTTDFVFKLKPEQKNNVYYLHVKTKDSLQVPLHLWHVDHFPKHNAYVNGLQGIYFGIMLVMILYNLFIYLSVRERSYLYYISYISTFTLFQASIQGFSFEYLWPNKTGWANISIPFLGVLSLFFASLFARSILQTHLLIPKFDKGLVMIAAALFCTLPVVLFADYDVGIIAALLCTFIFFNLVLVISCLAALKGNRTAKVFVVAWAIFLISGVISMLGALNVLPIEYASQVALQIGSAIEVILLSLALADRINVIEKEKVEIEAKSRETLLQANIQLENSNRLKDEFIATISHEIRTPMNGVLGSAQLLLDTQPDEYQSLYIDTINRSGQTLLEILNNILDYSKIEADKLELEPIEFELEEMVNECAEFFSVLASQNNVKLFVRIHRNTPKRIISDPVRFKQILLNLISNAFKFTSRGQVVVHVQLSEDSNNKIYIEVEDSGCGLTYEQQNILFQPFVQVDASSSREKGGTGLGLAISKKLTRLMQGDIGVHSLPGKGATFWFTAAIKVIEKETNNRFFSDKSVCLLLSNKYQETLIQEQLQDWEVNIISRNMLQYDNEINVISDNANLPELLNLGILAQNIIIISDSTHKLDEAVHTITSPITPQKLRHALRSCDSSLLKTSLQNEQRKIENKTPDFSQLRVLAVDDNSVNRMIIKKMLSKYKVEADIAVGGLDAMEFIREQKKTYDLILMDIEMPMKDGYQTTDDIRQYELEHNQRPCKIVAVSAHSMKESRGKALISGMDDFLSKPIDQNILIDVLTMTKTQSSTLQ